MFSKRKPSRVGQHGHPKKIHPQRSRVSCTLRQWTIRQFPLSHPFNHPCFPWAFYPRYALRAKMATLNKSPSPPRYSRPLLHLRRRRWVDAAETAELGGLRRRGAHRPGELLMLSTVAQTNCPRHSPGRPDLKPSPHPTRVLSHPLLLGTQGV